MIRKGYAITNRFYFPVCKPVRNRFDLLNFNPAIQKKQTTTTKQRGLSPVHLVMFVKICS